MNGELVQPPWAAYAASPVCTVSSWPQSARSPGGAGTSASVGPVADGTVASDSGDAPSGAPDAEAALCVNPEWMAYRREAQQRIKLCMCPSGVVGDAPPPHSCPLQIGRGGGRSRLSRRWSQTRWAGFTLTQPWLPRLRGGRTVVRAGSSSQQLLGRGHQAVRAGREAEMKRPCRVSRGRRGGMGTWAGGKGSVAVVTYGRRRRRSARTTASASTTVPWLERHMTSGRSLSMATRS